MRKILLFLFSFTYFFSFSQTEESTSTKNFFIGGNFSFSNENNNVPFQAGTIFINSFTSVEESSKQAINFSTYVGHQVNKNFSLGIDIDFYHNKSKYVYIYSGDPGRYASEYSSTIFGINLFGRYVINPDNKFNFFLKPNVGYNINNAKSIANSSTVENKAKYVSAGVGLGLLYNITDRWRLTASMGGVNYISGSWAESDTQPMQTFNQFYTRLNLSNTFIGLEFRF